MVENPDSDKGVSNEWDTYGNITAISSGMVTSPDGLLFTSPTKEQHELTVLGKTTVYLKALETGAADVYGLRQSTSSNGTVASLISLHDVDITVETNPSGVRRAKGIWVYGGYNPVGSEPSDIVPSQLTIDGTLSITAKTNEGYAIGINVGDEYGNNGYGNGEVWLKGSTNDIYIEQTGSQHESRATASAGILASDGGKVFIEGEPSQTHITLKTANRGGTTIQGGIVLDKSGFIQTEGTLEINGESTAGYDENHMQGISADYTGSYLYESQYGSQGTFDGATAIVLKGSSGSYLSGVGAYGASRLTFNGNLSIALDGSDNVANFDGIRASSTYLDINPNHYLGSAKSGGTVSINGGLCVSLPEEVSPGLYYIYSLHSIGLSGLNTEPSITVAGGIEDVIDLMGNVDASGGGIITLAMRNAASSLTGWADNHSNSTIDMTLANNAVWNVVSKFGGTKVTSETSKVSSLTLDGGVLDMTYLTNLGHEAWESTGHRQVLEINGTGSGAILSGTGGTIRMDVNLANEGNADDGLNLDQIIVHGDATGSHTLEVNFVGGLDGVDPDKWVSENWLIHQDGGDMTLTGPGGKTSIAGNGMVTLWDVKFVPDGQSSQLSDEDFRKSLVNTSSGKGDWYLVRHDELG